MTTTWDNIHPPTTAELAEVEAVRIIRRAAGIRWRRRQILRMIACWDLFWTAPSGRWADVRIVAGAIVCLAGFWWGIALLAVTR